MACDHTFPTECVTEVTGPNALLIVTEGKVIAAEGVKGGLGGEEPKGERIGNALAEERVSPGSVAGQEDTRYTVLGGPSKPALRMAVQAMLFQPDATRRQALRKDRF